MAGPPFEDPRNELDPVAALARQLERLQRAQALQEELLRGLAGDVSALVAQTPAQHPPPSSWLLTTDPDEAAGILVWLVGWVRDVYLWYPGSRLPSCWLWHPTAIEELWWLAQAHREAYDPPTKSITRACEWHERFLPGVIRRLAGAPYKDCELSRHLPGEDRDRTRAGGAPLAHAHLAVATAWVDQQIPEPTPLDLAEATKVDDHRSHP